MKKKPLNKVALLLWSLAVAAVILNSFELWNAYENLMMPEPAGRSGHLMQEAFVHSLSSVIVQFSILVALGTLVEIADRILWHVRK